MPSMNQERMYILIHPKNGACQGHARLHSKGSRVAVALSLSGMGKAPCRALLLSPLAAGAIIDLGIVSVSAMGQGRLSQDTFSLPAGVSVLDFSFLIICTDWPEAKIAAAGTLKSGPLPPLWQLQEAIAAYLTVPAKQQKALPEPPPLEAEPVPKPPQPPTNSLPLYALPPLHFPKAAQELRIYFDTLPPIAPFDAPGWRFVKVPLAGGVPAAYCAVGIFSKAHQVTQIAYALPASHGSPLPEELRGYQFTLGRHGQGYWTLTQSTKTL